MTPKNVQMPNPNPKYKPPGTPAGGRGENEMKAILLDEAKKWLEENCENLYTRMAVFGLMQSMPTVDYQEEPNEPLTLEELREMDGEPVWFDTIKRWGIVRVCGYGISVLTKSGEYDVTRMKFYRRPPDEAVDMVMERLEALRDE